MAKVTNLTVTVENLKKKGFWIFGTDGDAKQKYYECDYKCPVCVVVGSEGKGISSLLKSKCDYLVSIPMKGTIASLNVSVAAAIVIFEISKQREG